MKVNIRWESIDEHTAIALVGSQEKESVWIFIREVDGWQLNEMRPGA